MKVETIWTVMGSILHIEVSYPHPDTSTMIITTATVGTIHTTVHLYRSSIAIWYPVVADWETLALCILTHGLLGSWDGGQAGSLVFESVWIKKLICS